MHVLVILSLFRSAGAAPVSSDVPGPPPIASPAVEPGVGPGVGPAVEPGVGPGVGPAVDSAAAPPPVTGQEPVYLEQQLTRGPVSRADRAPSGVGWAVRTGAGHALGVDEFTT
ncbi:MAG: hypothetical protein EXR69_01755, partial [Myxococcales bacterium]|nr:hypothetical protein [Myxococcales bacterium]